MSVIEKSGSLGLLVFFGLYIASTVLMLPGTILTLGAGIVFGVVKGSLLVSLSSIAGATAAFVVSRYFARDLVARRIAGNETFRVVDEAVGHEGWKIVGLMRLSPIFPFNFTTPDMPLRKTVRFFSDQGLRNRKPEVQISSRESGAGFVQRIAYKRYRLGAMG